ncbi:hypothetical protein Tco_1366443 [Tanacetum coccineum]
MIGREILGSFSVNYFEIELLKEENPPEQSRLGILFSKKIFEGGMVRMHDAFVHDEVRPEFFKSIHYGKTAPIAKSLASHMSSKGKSQSGAIKIGASVNFLLSVLKDSIHSFEKKNGVSFSSKWVIGRAIFEKSCMKRR